MKALGSLVGVGLAVGTLLLLPLMVAASSGGEDLRVEMPSANRFDIRSRPDILGIAAKEVDPPTATVTHLLPDAASGIDLTTWRVSYGGGYDREVTWPTLVGPFTPENEYVCGYTFHLGASLFDTSGAGRGLVVLLGKKLASAFPKTIDESGVHVVIPAVQTTNLAIRLERGQIHVQVDLTLMDQTRLSVGFPVEIVSRGHVPVISRIKDVSPTVTFEGPTPDEIRKQAREAGGGAGAVGGCAAGSLLGPLGCLGGALLGGVLGSDAGEGMAASKLQETTEQEASDQVDKALGEFALGMKGIGKPIHLFPDRPDDFVQLQVNVDPDISPSGITIPACIRVSIQDGRVDQSVVGAIHHEASPPSLAEFGSLDSEIGVVADPDGIEQIIYYFWQSGRLATIGQSRSAMDALDRSVRAAAFDFTGFAPGLPPTLSPTSAPEGLRFTLADVEIGTLHGSRATVVAHGLADLDIVQEGDRIDLRGALDDLRVNCVDRSSGTALLRPCLADLLPIARRLAVHRPIGTTFAGADLLAKLPTVGFQGAALTLSGLTARASGSPPSVTLQAHARFE